MPTGVPIRDVRDQLFDAARSVLRRDGPDALTSRAVTAEAGLAKGILHRHFADFTGFLAALVLARIEVLDSRSKELRVGAGSGTVADRLAAALTASLDADSLAMVSLVMARRDLLARLRLTTPTGIPLLAETTRMIGAYLTAERGLGRIALDTDVDRLALALVGAAHLLLTGHDGPPDADEVRALVVTLISPALRPSAIGAGTDHPAP